MEKIQWRKIQWRKFIVLHLLVVIITCLLFIPADIIVFKDYLIKNFIDYLFKNFVLLCIFVFICVILVSLNNKFWRGNNIVRTILEIVFAIITINIILFVFQNLFGTKHNIKNFILYIIKDRYAFTTCSEGVFVILMIKVIYLYYKRNEDEREKEKIKYIQLKNQLNPHFLFNSLSASISLIKRDQIKAVDYMKELSLIYRYVLTNTENDFVSLEEEINFIKKYINILQIRYEDRLNVSYNIDNKTLNMQIVPLSLQLLVENAVKHNSTYSYNPLNINIYSEGNQIMVTNNIIKKTAVIDSIGVGLKNLNQKYNILFSKNIQIINDSINFIVKIPLK